MQYVFICNYILPYKIQTPFIELKRIEAKLYSSKIKRNILIKMYISVIPYLLLFSDF